MSGGSVISTGGGRLLKMSEVAELLGVGKRTVYRLVAAGELDVVKVRSATRIPAAAVQSYVKRNMSRQG
jgi:excisionase family DNA binding protein